MNNKLFLDNLHSIQDWPIRGVNSEDAITLLKNPEHLRTTSDETYELYKSKGITRIVGTENRDFVVSSAIAIRSGAGTVLCRKPGKLPREAVQESYMEEYGIDTIEIHEDVISKNDIVLLHGDPLAAGGIMKATYNLMKKFHPEKIYANFTTELKGRFSHYREQFDKDIEIESLSQFQPTVTNVGGSGKQTLPPSHDIRAAAFRIEEYVDILHKTIRPLLPVIQGLIVMNKEKNLKRIDHLESITLNMSGKSGSYQFYDRDHQVVCVGKVRNLKNHVSSYFREKVDCYKTKMPVSKAWDITYTVANMKEDALLFENSLIEKYNPHYNVLLRDGKTYPSICITKEYLLRIPKTRRADRRSGTYYGPYSQVIITYSLPEFIEKLYKPRIRRFPITSEDISQGKYEPCLGYHIHNCKAPCVGKRTHENYHESIAQAYEILKGNTREVSKIPYQQILKKVEELRSEEAEGFKQKYGILSSFVVRSEAVSNTIQDLNVFTLTDDDQKKNALINYIHAKNGTINQGFTFECKRKLNGTDGELLVTAIQEIRSRFKSKVKEAIVFPEINWSLNNATSFIPQCEGKKHLLDLSEMSGKQCRLDRLK